MENISATTEFITNYAEILKVNFTEYGNITDTVNSTETSDVIVARLEDVTTIIASLWITIAVIGFLGNALLFVMTHNQSIRDQSYALFLCVLSIVDSIVLFVRLTQGSALLASTHSKPQGPLVGILDTNVACVLTGLELSARCLSAWIGRVIDPFPPTANAESRAVEAFSLCVFTSTKISEWSPMEQRAPAQGSSQDQCI